MEFSKLEMNDYPSFLKLYNEAFPADERREYRDERHLAEFIKMKGGKFDAFVAKDGDFFIGFMSYWRFEKYVYVEHFAVVPEQRGRNIGKLMLNHLFKEVGENVIGEVEMPDTEIACRRIGFYERNGFRVRKEFVYMQPPYDPSKKPVPMLIITHGNVDLHNMDSISDMLREVYNVNHPVEKA